VEKLPISHVLFWYSDILPTGALISCYTPVVFGLSRLSGFFSFSGLFSLSGLFGFSGLSDYKRRIIKFCRFLFGDL